MYIYKLVVVLLFLISYTILYSYIEFLVDILYCYFIAIYIINSILIPYKTLFIRCLWYYCED